MQHYPLDIMESPATTIATSFLGPIFFLNIWTLIMEVVMYYYRLPIFVKLDVTSKPDLTIEQINRQVPPSVRWKADNFNNLMEQPMNFYVVVLATALGHYWKGESVGGGHITDLTLAWTYVGLRLLHSYMQCMGNRVAKRFYVFLTSSVVLSVLTARGALMVARSF